MTRGPVLYDAQRLFAPDGAHRRTLLLLLEWGELSIEGVALRQRLSYHFTHAILDRGVNCGLLRLHAEAGLYSLGPRGRKFLAQLGLTDQGGMRNDSSGQADDPHAAAVA